MKIITKIYQESKIIKAVLADNNWEIKKTVIANINKGIEYRTLSNKGPIVEVIEDNIKTKNNILSDDNLDNLPPVSKSDLPTLTIVELIRQNNERNSC